MANEKSKVAPKRSTEGQLNLVLPKDLLAFVDVLRKTVAPAGVTFSRQDAIRATLARLKAEMAAQTPPPRKHN